MHKRVNAWLQTQEPKKKIKGVYTGFFSNDHDDKNIATLFKMFEIVFF